MMTEYIAPAEIWATSCKESYDEIKPALLMMPNSLAWHIGSLFIQEYTILSIGDFDL